MYNILDGPYSLGSWVRGGPYSLREYGPPDRKLGRTVYPMTPAITLFKRHQSDLYTRPFILTCNRLIQTAYCIFDVCTCRVAEGQPGLTGRPAGQTGLSAWPGRPDSHLTGRDPPTKGGVECHTNACASNYMHCIIKDSFD